MNSLWNLLEGGADAQQVYNSLTPEQRLAVMYEWALWARPLESTDKPRVFRGQIPPPGEWLTCAFLGGRGAGKTRSLAEWCREKAEGEDGCRVHLVGSDMGEARKVGVFGESGVMNCCPPWNKPDWSTIDNALRWRPRGSKSGWGSQLFLFSAEAPKTLRGPQCHYLAADELAAWNRGNPEPVWNLAIFGCRLRPKKGPPQRFIATTPTPIKLLVDLLAEETTVVLRGSIYENPFLPDSYVEDMNRKFAGTSFGRQELEGELLEQVDGALWTLKTLEKWRVVRYPQMRKIIVSVDPSASTVEGKHDEAGVMTLGLGVDGHEYVLADDSDEMTPHDWATRIVRAATIWGAAYVVAESQRGGKMVETLIHKTEGGEKILVKNRGAEAAKEVRALPVAAASERGIIHMVGTYAQLERELTTWIPNASQSPGRLDAFVHGSLDLLQIGAPVEYHSLRGVLQRRM